MLSFVDAWVWLWIVKLVRGPLLYGKLTKRRDRPPPLNFLAYRIDEW